MPTSILLHGYRLGQILQNKRYRAEFIRRMSRGRPLHLPVLSILWHQVLLFLSSPCLYLQEPEDVTQALYIFTKQPLPLDHAALGIVGFDALSV